MSQSTMTIDDRMRLFTEYLEWKGLEKKSYQYEGVRWILENELNPDPVQGVRGGLIADEMGLGKTIMMIGTMFSNYQKQTLIVVPPILLDQWYIQIYKTTGHKPLVYHGIGKKAMENDLKKALVVITTYGAVTMTRLQLKNKHKTPLHKIHWPRIIFDEAHHLRNSATTRHASVLQLKSSIRWLVTGTPVQNSRKDFYNLCTIIGLPPMYYTDLYNMNEIKQEFILKRTKEDVHINMTSVIEGRHKLAWLNKEEKNLSEAVHSLLQFSHVPTSKSNTFTDTLKRNCVNPLNMMLHARQSCILPKLMRNKFNSMLDIDFNAYKEAFDHSSKIQGVVNKILEGKDNGCGKIIFCHFREEIDEVVARLRIGGMNRVATIDGRTRSSARSNILSGHYDALVLQIQTGCEGLNLQENYSEIYFISPHWNPAVEDQAIARCHRIGQKKQVVVQRFEMCNFVNEVEEMDTMTVENYIENMQSNKRIISSTCVS